MNHDIRQLVHDARNPLNNISMNAELGKLTLNTKGDIEKATELFEKIVAECQRCGQSLEALSHAVNEEQASKESQ